MKKQHGGGGESRAKIKDQNPVDHRPDLVPVAAVGTTGNQHQKTRRTTDQRRRRRSEEDNEGEKSTMRQAVGHRSCRKSRNAAVC